MNEVISAEAEHEEELVSVAGFRDPTEAQFAKGMLEAAGITTVMQGENANALYPGALRVRLQVRTADEAAARALLSDAEIPGRRRGLRVHVPQSSSASLVAWIRACVPLSPRVTTMSTRYISATASAPKHVSDGLLKR